MLHTKQELHELRHRQLQYRLLSLCCRKDEEYFGYTDTNKLVNIKNGTDDIIGKIVKVKITDAKTWSLDGEYVSR